MLKAYIIKASNGAEIIDTRPDAEIHLDNEMALYERINREKRFANRKKKNPLRKFASMCGLL